MPLVCDSVPLIVVLLLLLLLLLCSCGTASKQASMSKKVKSAEKAYVKLALAYDRFMKAGDISPM